MYCVLYYVFDPLIAYLKMPRHVSNPGLLDTSSPGASISSYTSSIKTSNASREYRWKQMKARCAQLEQANSVLVVGGAQATTSGMNAGALDGAQSVALELMLQMRHGGG